MKGDAVIDFEFKERLGMDADLFGKRLTELREGRGLNQKELAEEIGVKQNTVSQWELGKREPYLKTVIQLAEFFGVDIKAFLEHDQPPHPDRKHGKKR